MITVFYDHVLNASKQTGKSIKSIIKTIREAGIEGLEMDYLELEKNSFLFSYRLRKWGTPINSCYKTFDWGNNPDTDDYKPVINKLKKLKIYNLLVIPGFVKDADDREQLRNNMLSVLKRCITYAEENGIKVYMEDFDDNVAPFGTIDELKWFMDNEPRLSIAFDTGNFLYSEEDASLAYPIFENRIGYVHCKDRSFTEIKGEEPKATVKERNMYSSSVGSGVIPMLEIVTKLKESGYKGTYAIEHFGSLNHLEVMLASANWLIKIL